MFVFEQINAQDTIFDVYHKPKEIRLFDANGQKTGEWKWFYSNGNLQRTATYKYSQLNGECKSFNSDGEVNGKFLFRNDSMMQYTTYSSPLNKLIETNYLGKDVLHGERKVYFDNGNIEYLEHYKYGHADGEQIGYFQNGKLRFKGYMVNGIQEGKEIRYFDNGQLESEITFINGKEVGKHKVYYRNGNLAQSGQMKNGKRVGEWKMYEENKNLSSYFFYDHDGNQLIWIQYKNGKKDWYLNNNNRYYERYYADGNMQSCGYYGDSTPSGEWKEFYPNGQLSQCGNYINNSEIGLWTYYFESGKIKKQVIYDDPRVLSRYRQIYWKEFFENGQILGSYDKIDSLHYEIKYYYPNGQLKELSLLNIKGEPSLSKKYYQDGKIESTGNVRGGNVFGEWKYFYESGKLKEIKSYGYGYLDGVWARFYSNGNMQEGGMYKLDQKSGEWKLYYENGQLKEIGTYDKGIKSGDWKHYDENGNSMK